MRQIGRLHCGYNVISLTRYHVYNPISDSSCSLKGAFARHRLSGQDPRHPRAEGIPHSGGPGSPGGHYGPPARSWLTASQEARCESVGPGPTKELHVERRRRALRIATECRTPPRNGLANHSRRAGRFAAAQGPIARARVSRRSAPFVSGSAMGMPGCERIARKFFHDRRAGTSLRCFLPALQKRRPRT